MAGGCEIMENKIARNIVFIVHYFPPINSSGAKRVEALSKYLSRWGRNITVITTQKTGADGAFTEKFPEGVNVLQLNRFGSVKDSIEAAGAHEPMYTERPSLKRRIKEFVMDCFGQLPDPRLPFAFSFLRPKLDRRVEEALADADIVVGSCPPWSMLLAAVFVKGRFAKPIILDYRDNFSDCHEMPGSKPAKFVERVVDRWLCKKADRLVVISEPMARYYSQFHNKVSVIMNGYDPEAIQTAQNKVKWEAPQGRSLTIRYLGIVSPGRVPHNMLRAFRTAARAKNFPPGSIRFEYYGTAGVLQQLLSSDYKEIAEWFHFYPAVSYQEALQLMCGADYLLFCETSTGTSLSAQGILTTKLFEYLASGRPVIGDISPHTLAGSTLCKAGEHHLVSTSEDDFYRFLTSDLFWTPPASTVSPFTKTLSRSSQAQQYLHLMDSTVD